MEVIPTTVAATPAESVRVFQVIEGGEGYGVASVLRLIAQQFPGVHFISLAEGRFCRELPPDRLVHVGSYFLGGIASISTAKILWGILKTSPSWWRSAGEIARSLGNGPVILHCHSQVVSLVAVMVRLRRPGQVTRVMLHFHGKMSNRFWGLVRKMQVLLIGSCVDRIICVSSFVSSYWRGARCPVDVVYNAIAPLTDVCQTGIEHSPAERKILLMAASISFEKGQLTAIEALEILSEQRIDLDLWIAGGPLDESINPFIGELRKRIAVARLGNKVRFLGEVNTVRQLTKKAWLGLQLRISPEPCSMWVLESLGAGLPLVATNTGGTPELVRDGVDGVLINPGRPNELAESIRSLYEDNDRYSRLAGNAARRATTFSVARFTDSLDSLYAKLASSELTSPTPCQKPAHHETSS